MWNISGSASVGRQWDMEHATSDLLLVLIFWSFFVDMASSVDWRLHLAFKKACMEALYTILFFCS